MKYILLVLFLILVCCSYENVEISAATMETENM